MPCVNDRAKSFPTRLDSLDLERAYYRCETWGPAACRSTMPWGWSAGAERGSAPKRRHSGTSEQARPMRGGGPSPAVLLGRQPKARTLPRLTATGACSSQRGRRGGAQGSGPVTTTSGRARAGAGRALKPLPAFGPYGTAGAGMLCVTRSSRPPPHRTGYSLQSRPAPPAHRRREAEEHTEGQGRGLRDDDERKVIYVGDALAIQPVLGVEPEAELLASAHRE